MNERLTRDYEANLKAIRAGSWEPAIFITMIGSMVLLLVGLLGYALYRQNALWSVLGVLSALGLLIVAVRQVIFWHRLRKLNKEFAVRAMTE